MTDTHSCSTGCHGDVFLRVRYLLLCSSSCLFYNGRFQLWVPRIKAKVIPILCSNVNREEFQLVWNIYLRTLRNWFWRRWIVFPNTAKFNEKVLIGNDFIIQNLSNLICLLEFVPVIAGHDAKTIPVSQGLNCSYCVNVIGKNPIPVLKVWVYGSSGLVFLKQG